jgi:hypothetical protein
MQEKFRVYCFCFKRWLLVIFASPKSVLADSVLIAEPRPTAGIASAPSLPIRESEGSAGRVSRTPAVANLSYNTVQIISNLANCGCTSCKMKMKASSAVGAKQILVVIA